MGGSVTSVVIAAHNEQEVIGACLDALLSDDDGRTLEIVVVANGCTDATAEVARSKSGIVVIELDEGSKPKALNAGDSIAGSFPRIYLDADIVLPQGCVRGLVAALSNTSGLAATASRLVDARGSSPLVRAYFAVNERLPVYQEGLFGRGVIALSKEGRSRFDRFPLVVADDLYVDSLFKSHEKVQVRDLTVVVSAPTRTRDLLRRLERVRRGNAALREAYSDRTVEVRKPDRWSWLRDVVAPDPRLWPAGLVYGLFTAYAALAARIGSPTSMAWGRSGSTIGR